MYLLSFYCYLNTLFLLYQRKKRDKKDCNTERKQAIFPINTKKFYL